MDIQDLLWLYKNYHLFKFHSNTYLRKISKSTQKELWNLLKLQIYEYKLSRLQTARLSSLVFQRLHTLLAFLHHLVLIWGPHLALLMYSESFLRCRGDHMVNRWFYLGGYVQGNQLICCTISWSSQSFNPYKIL